VAEGLASASGVPLLHTDDDGPACEGRDISGGHPSSQLLPGEDISDKGVRGGDGLESANLVPAVGASSIVDDGVALQGGNQNIVDAPEPQGEEGVHVGKKARLSAGEGSIVGSEGEQSLLQTRVHTGPRREASKVVKGQQGITSFFSKAGK